LHQYDFSNDDNRKMTVSLSLKLPAKIGRNFIVAELNEKIVNYLDTPAYEAFEDDKQIHQESEVLLDLWNADL
jgi:hypothetical protein